MSVIKSNAITSLDTPFLAYLKQDLTEAIGVKLVISFLMETGAQLLLDDLKHLASKGVPIKVLTGRYLHVTQPSAIYLLKKELGKTLDIRFYKQQNISFHPKAYIIDKATDGARISSTATPYRMDNRDILAFCDSDRMGITLGSILGLMLGRP